MFKSEQKSYFFARGKKKFTKDKSCLGHPILKLETLNHHTYDPTN